MKKYLQTLIFVVLAVATIKAVNGQVTEDPIGKELNELVREYCLEQRYGTDYKSQKLNEIRDKRQYYSASRRLVDVAKASRNRRQTEDNELTRTSLDQKEDLEIYSSIVQLEQYVNNACKQIYEEVDSQKEKQRRLP